MSKDGKKPKKGGIAVVISIGGKPKGAHGDEPKMKPGFPIDKAQLALLKALTTEELREASRTGGIRRLPGTQGALTGDVYEHGRGTKDARLTGAGANRVVAAQRAGDADGMTMGGGRWMHDGSEDVMTRPQFDMGGRMPKSSVMGEGADTVSGENAILQPHEYDMMTELHPELRDAALADFHASHGARIQDETDPVGAGTDEPHSRDEDLRYLHSTIPAKYRQPSQRDLDYSRRFGGWYDDSSANNDRLGRESGRNWVEGHSPQPKLIAPARDVHGLLDHSQPSDSVDPYDFQRQGELRRTRGPHDKALADFRMGRFIYPPKASNKPESLDAERDAALKPPSADAALRETYGDDRADRVAVQDTIRDLSDTAGMQGLKQGLQEEIAHNKRLMDTKERREAAAKAKADAKMQQSLSGDRPPPVAGSAEARNFSAARSAQKPSNPRRGGRRRFMTNAQKRNRQMRRKSEPMDLAFRLLKGWADEVEPSSEDDPEGRRARENDQFEEFMSNLDDPEFAADVDRDPEPLGDSAGTATADSAMVRRLIRLLGENKVPGMRR